MRVVAVAELFHALLQVARVAVLGGLALADARRLANPFVGEELEVNHVLPELLAEQDDRDLLHPLSLSQCQGVEQFVECSKPAGHGDKSVCHFGHQGFAFMHGVDNPQILKMSEGNFFIDQNLRDNADNVPVSTNHRVGNFTHQTDVASTIDKGDTMFS